MVIFHSGVSLPEGMKMYEMSIYRRTILRCEVMGSAGTAGGLATATEQVNNCLLANHCQILQIKSSSLVHQVL